MGLKKEAKQEKKRILLADMEEDISAHEMRNHHPLRLPDMYRRFPDHKRKWVKKAWGSLK